MIHKLIPIPDAKAIRLLVRLGITNLWNIRNRAHDQSLLDILSDEFEYITHCLVQCKRTIEYV